MVVGREVLLLTMRDVPASELGPGTGCPDCGFPLFFQENSDIIPKLGHDSFLPSFINHAVI
jgi:hypothetical protein